MTETVADTRTESEATTIRHTQGMIKTGTTHAPTHPHTDLDMSAHALTQAQNPRTDSAACDM